MLHYEPARDGYERAGLYIQCVPLNSPNGQPGTFLQTDTGQLLSPVFADLYEFNRWNWDTRQGWKEVPGIVLVYEREI